MKSTPIPPFKIAVVGLGYVGCVSAACLAQLGHVVVGIDRDEFKVSSILGSRAPFFEPGLEELIAENVRAGRLTATTASADALQDADVAFVCVGTPSHPNGDLDLSQVERIASEIASRIANRTRPLIVAIRSTVFPGTCDSMLAPIFASLPVQLVSHPEFLREGSAVRDFLEPSLIVVGSNDASAADFISSLYSPLGAPVCRVGIRTAELIKYSCNAFHAVKIAFANEIGALASQMGVDPIEVMDTLCKDAKLNVSKAYLKPGFAFGGSCLPKDLRAISFRAQRLDLSLPLLSATLPSNNEHLMRSIQSVLQVESPRIGVIGLAFKENTDDVRESPVIALLEHLIGKGRDIRVYDPHIQIDELYGSNRNFMMASLPHIGRLMDKDLAQTLAWASHVVLAQNQTPAVMAQIRGSGLPVTDLVRALEPSKLA